jgi:hypothetical protein
MCFFVYYYTHVAGESKTPVDSQSRDPLPFSLPSSFHCCDRCHCQPCLHLNAIVDVGRSSLQLAGRYNSGNGAARLNIDTFVKYDIRYFTAPGSSQS